MLAFNYFIVKTRELLGKEEGQGLVEYALIIVLISIVAIVMMGPLGDQIAAVFEEITGELGGAAAGT